MKPAARSCLGARRTRLPAGFFPAETRSPVGLVKSSPQRIIADGTDWRFLNELKRELKA